MDEENAQLIETLEMARARVEILLANVLLQRTMIDDLLRCARNPGGVDPNDLRERCAQYSQEIEQEPWEKVEDSDPRLAAAVDLTASC